MVIPSQFMVLILSNASKAMGYILPFVEEVYLHMLVLISFMYVKYRAAAASSWFEALQTKCVPVQ